MTWLIAWALRRGWAGWAAKLFGWGVPALAMIAALGGIYLTIYGWGEQHQIVKQATDHTKRVAEARHDERGAQASASAIGAAVTTRNDAATRAADDRKETIRHVQTLPPPAGDPAALPVVDSVRLATTLDAGVDRANRAGEAADD